jgi:hypothetical protein
VEGDDAVPPLGDFAELRLVAGFALAVVPSAGLAADLLLEVPLAGFAAGVELAADAVPFADLALAGLAAVVPLADFTARAAEVVLRPGFAGAAPAASVPAASSGAAPAASAGAAVAATVASAVAACAAECGASSGLGALRVPGGISSGPVAAARAAVVRSANRT